MTDDTEARIKLIEETLEDPDDFMIRELRWAVEEIRNLRRLIGETKALEKVVESDTRLHAVQRERDALKAEVEELQQRQDECIVALGSRGILPSELPQEIKKLKADRGDWRKGVALIAAALGEKHPPNLSCTRIARDVLQLKAALAEARQLLKDVIDDDDSPVWETPQLQEWMERRDAFLGRMQE